MNVRVGTAGWSIPRSSATSCPGDGTHLHRYGRVFRAAEINSSFHRPHAAETYARWAQCVPREFRFAVKVPRAITHDARLRRSRALFERFIDEARGLGSRLGPLLVQLPPSLEFDRRVAQRFFAMMRSFVDQPIVCEPRHPTWFTRPVDTLLKELEIARVAADPPPAADADTPGGHGAITYFRLHGSPRKYWSRYPNEWLHRLAAQLAASPAAERWCIFDNTASGAALANALELQAIISGVTSRHGARVGE